MRQVITIEDIKKSACAHLNKHLFEEEEAKKKVAKKERKPSRSKEKEWLQRELQKWTEDNNLILNKEYKFFDYRKWQFDWAIVSLMVGIEYEGLMSQKSRHTTISGFTGDTEKYSKAAILGWKVIRVTALNYRNIINQLNEI